MAKEKVISAIDIGSSKITTIIAQVEEEQIQIIGVSTIPSRGIKKGVVVDIDQAVESISESLEGAERMAGYAVSQAYITVNGQHISSLNSTGVVAVASPDNEITAQDVDRVIEAARAVSIPSSREIVHVVPRQFTVDSQEGVQDPAGMSGVRLQVETHIISGAVTSMRNLIKCTQQVGVDVEDLVFAGLGAAESVLSETEKELGVLLLDIGGGTSDLIIYVDGSPVYSAVLPIGGKNITNDIAIAMRISLEDAEKLKIFLSQYQPPTLPSEKEKAERRGRLVEEEKEEIDVGELSIGDLHTADRKFLRDGIIRPRLEEIIEEAQKELRKSGLESLTPAGIVLCGGAAETIGFGELAKKMLRLPARIGKPSGVSGLIEEVSTPAAAAAIGTILFAARTARPARLLGFPTTLPNLGEYVKKVINLLKSLLP